MKKFKEYCRLKQLVEKDKESIGDIMNLLEKRRTDFIVYFLLSVVMVGFINVPIIIFNLIIFDVVSTGMKFFLAFVFLIDILFGILFFFIKYVDYYEYYHKGKHLTRELKKLNIPKYYFKLKEYCDIYHDNEKKMQGLHNKITTKVYLEKINNQSDELNIYEYGVLENLFEEDNKERIKLEKSVISNY